MTPARPTHDLMSICRNAMSGVGARLAMMVVGFSLTPFIVHALGLQQYGMWAVVGSLANYLGLLDFGLGSAFVKFLSEFLERGEHARARQVLVFGMTFYTLFGLVLALPVMLAAPWLVHLFKMPADQYANAVRVFDASFVLLIVTTVIGLPGAALIAVGRMDLVNRNVFLGYLAYAVATVGFIALGWGIWGVIAAQFVQTLVGTSLQVITARRHFGSLWHNPLRIERAIVRRMLGFGGWTQFTQILNVVSLDVGRFISAGVVSVASVTYYEIGSKLAYFAKSMPTYLLDAIMPGAAAADARGDAATLDDLYRNGTVYTMFATLAIIGFLIGAAGPVVRVWMGVDFPYVGAIVLWLGIGYALNGLTGGAATMLRASGRPGVETWATGVAAAVNLTATALLARPFGIIGVAAGTAIGWAAATVYLLVRFHSIAGTNWWTTIGARVARLALACAVAAGLLRLLVGAPTVADAFAHRLPGLVMLAAAGTVYVAVFVALTGLFGAWRPDDTRLFRRGIARTTRLFALARGGAH